MTMMKLNGRRTRKNSQISLIQPFGRIRQSQIRQQCDKLLELGVIRHSTASEWSQVHMVPKPTPGEWRFTLDFVRLNDCTSDLEGWSITLIRPLFQRLRARKPKYFGKLDLTAGYHQAPLDEASRAYTAFRTIHGLYEWTRVPADLRVIHRRSTDRWCRRRYVCQQRKASFCSVPKTQNYREMLMYVGLVNYFHDHVRNMNDLLRPLQKMVEHYDKHKRLEWTQMGHM